MITTSPSVYATTCVRKGHGCTAKKACLRHDGRWTLPTAANVIATYRLATADEVERGWAWYADGAKLALALGGTVERGAGVIAALSPQEGWASNMNLAARAFADGEASGQVGNACEKADRIMAGEAPLDVLGGRKVRSFYASFLVAAGIATEDADPVCVDRHAIAIACGHIVDAKGIKVLARKHAYDLVADAYRAAALELGVPAYVLQAITWVTHRRLKGIVDVADLEDF